MEHRHRHPLHSPGAHNPATLAQPQGAQPPVTCGKPGVLVVDDDHFVRAVVQLGLERDGFEVWSASNGYEAIDLYREHADVIAVVLLDVRMPVLDGPQTLSALRTLNPELRACFMTGDPGEYTREELMERSAACVIDKPFQLAGLKNVLRPLACGADADPASVAAPE